MALDGAHAPKSTLPALLNTLLEAERAGAKVLTAYLKEYEEDAPETAVLRNVQRDESHNCRVLMELLHRMNMPQSTATGAFLEKALKVEGKAERILFLNVGQQWVAREIKKALPSVTDPEARHALALMHESHIRNIELCDYLLRRR